MRKRIPASVNAALTSVSNNSKATANGMATFHTVSYARDVEGMMLKVDNIIPRNNDIIGEERRDPNHVCTSRDFGGQGMGKGRSGGTLVLLRTCGHQNR